MSDEVLLTALAEAERIVNDKPIALIYDDPQQPKALRPSDLLILRSNSGLTTGDIPLREKMTERWNQAQLLAATFWKQRRREYLPTLQATNKWLKPHRNLKPGDVVLVSKTDGPRGQWLLGVVSETFPGMDGLVRQAMFKTNAGLVRRDVRSLCLLEEAEE